MQEAWNRRAARVCTQEPCTRRSQGMHTGTMHQVLPEYTHRNHAPGAAKVCTQEPCNKRSQSMHTGIMHQALAEYTLSSKEMSEVSTITEEEYYCKVTTASASKKPITSENPSFIYSLRGEEPGCWVPGVGVTCTPGPWCWSDLCAGSLVLEWPLCWVPGVRVTCTPFLVCLSCVYS